jgi:hypothetical protein
MNLVPVYSASTLAPKVSPEEYVLVDCGGHALLGECPMCGGRPVIQKRFPLEQWSVVCLNCGYRTDWVPTCAEAINPWIVLNALRK